MSPLDTPALQPLPEGTPQAPIRRSTGPSSPPIVDLAAARYHRSMAAKVAWAERKDRERRRVEIEWSARSKRERVRRTGERLVAAVESLRAVEARMTLAEGGILTELVYLDQYESLGFVRQSDFSREALKLHPRTLRRRVALHRVLEAVPALVDPFLEGRVGVSQVLALRDVVTAENATIWVNVSERLSVRELQSLTKRVKEKREREVAGEAAAETGASEADSDPDTDSLEEPHRQRISFLAPQSAAFAIEHGLETAKRALGYEAPRDECLEAVLSEAESSMALPPVDGTPQNHGAENVVRSTDGTASGTENVVRPEVDGKPATSATTTTPYDGPVWYHKRELKAARRLLTAVDRRLARLDRLTKAPRPIDSSSEGNDASNGTDPSEDVRRLTAGALVDRYLALQQQKNPIRILIARTLYHLTTLGAGALLGHGYEDNIDMAAKLLKVTPRSARDLIQAGFGFNYFPPLANAYARGHIGFGQVVALSYEVGGGTLEWIHRAREVTARQFRREVRLLRRLSDAVPNKLGFHDGAFPRPELEATLRKRLFELGWKQEDLDRELGERGILSPPSTSTDPAENPAQMARLETLVDMLTLERCRQEDTAPGIGKMLSVPGRHRRVTVWARDPIVRHWQDVQSRILAHCDHLPDWAVATLLVKAAQDEWDRTDPTRIPTERKILERDAYLCQAPGCSSRKNLEVHHIIFRSLGGSNEDWNLVTLCHMHHHHAVHRHTMRVTGEAPYNLTWEMGLDYLGYVRVARGTVRKYRGPARWVYHGERLTNRMDNHHRSTAPTFHVEPLTPLNKPQQREREPARLSA